MIIRILTLFPEFFQTPLQTSILKRATSQEIVGFDVINIRDFTTDKHKITDDRPYGGGPGMVMKVEPIDRALQSLPAIKGTRKVILTSAKGQLFTQQHALAWSRLEELVIICGHYEGVDERVKEHLIDDEVRIGDFVLTGGEPAAVVLSDAVSRLIPGVLGNDESNKDESHTSQGFLGFPQYTRPEVYKGWKVPEVLLTGNHKDILAWRQAAKKKVG